MNRIISVASGNAGVGKTTISVNLALQIAAMGYRTCLLQTNPEFLKNHVPLGISSENNLESVFLGKSTISDIVIKNYYESDLLFAGDALKTAASLDVEEKKRILRSFSETNGYDFFIIDTCVDDLDIMVSFCMASPEVLLVISPDSNSLTHAYSLMKTLGSKGYNGFLSIVLNQYNGSQDIHLIFEKLNKSIKNSFSLDLTSIENIGKDPLVAKACCENQPFCMEYPQSRGAKDLQKIAKDLMGRKPDKIPTCTIDAFWERVFNFLTASLISVPVVRPDKKIHQNKPGQCEPIIKIKTSETKTASWKTAGLSPDNDFEKISGENNFFGILDDLSGSISSLSNEIKDIKELMTHQKNITQELQFSDYKSLESPKIVLDFEAFLSGKMKDQDNKPRR